VEISVTITMSKEEAEQVELKPANDLAPEFLTLLGADMVDDQCRVFVNVTEQGSNVPPPEPPEPPAPEVEPLA